MLIKFSGKHQGTSHIEKEIPCQDAANTQLGSSKTVGIALVADGHGGSKYSRSDKGSFFAVEVASKLLFLFYATLAKEKSAFFDKKIKNEIQQEKEIREKLKQLEGNIILKWRDKVLDDLRKNHLTEKEKEICKNSNIEYVEDEPSTLIFFYGTTLLASLVSENFWFAVQIGDGLCIKIENNGEVKSPISPDDRLGFGRTTSLCDSNAIDNFRENFGLEKIKGITVATDGVVDSFELEKYLEFNRDLYENFIKASETSESELRNFLPKLSERGSRDDVAIAGIFRMP
jgi:serine/threonine protein phosphatase PrpC